VSGNRGKFVQEAHNFVVLIDNLGDIEVDISEASFQRWHRK
jgi:hypothetical protein